MFPTWNFFLGLLPTPRVWVVPQTQSFLCSVDKSEQLKRRSREGCHSEMFYFLGLSSQTFPSPNQASRTFHPQSRLPWQPLQLQTIPFSAREMGRWSGRMTWEQHSNSHRQVGGFALLPFVPTGVPDVGLQGLLGARSGLSPSTTSTPVSPTSSAALGSSSLTTWRVGPRGSSAPTCRSRSSPLPCLWTRHK